MRSSSVMALFSFIAPFVLADCFALVFDADCSFREEFLAFAGILPDMYRAARPAPVFNGGNRRAMMDVDRGIMVVSSSYSSIVLVAGKFKSHTRKPTFIPILVIDGKIELCTIAESALDDDITFQIEHGNTGSIKFHPGGLFLRFELEEH